MLMPLKIQIVLPALFSRLAAIVFASVFLFSVSASAKTGVTDLERSLATAHSDSEQLRIYTDLFVYFEYSNPDSVIYYMKQGLSLFTKHNYKPGIATTLTSLGGIYSLRGMADVAKKAEEDALKIYTEINSPSGIANVNGVLGVIEGKKGNFSEASSHFFTSLRIYETLKDTSGITDTYIKLGAVNENSNNHDKAREYYNRGLDYLKGKPVNDVVIFLNNNIGVTYLSNKDTKNALKYLQLALDESDDSMYAQIRILPLTNLCDVYASAGDTTKALHYAQQALDIAVREHLPGDKANILMSIAALTQKANPAKAFAELGEALQTAEEIGEKKLQADIMNNIIAIYKEKGDYKAAFTMQEKQRALQDSILSIDKAKAIANLEALHDLDKMHSKVQQLEVSELEQQQKKNIIFIIAAFLTVCLLIVSFFLWKTHKLNAELSAQDIQLKKASSIKNRLISIIAHDLIGSIGFMPLAIGLCKDISVDPEEKNALLTQLELNAIGSFDTLRNMLDWGKSQIMGIALAQTDIHVAELSSDVLKLINIAASYKQLTITNNISPDLTVFADPDHFKFILRNLLSNAVKFSLVHGSIDINAHRSDDGRYVIFSVSDNGIGMNGEIAARIFDYNGSTMKGTANEKGNGIGLGLCKEFVTENGGEIWVESEENKRSVFYFSLKANQ